MKISKLWDSLAKEKFATVDDTFLSNFREPGNANNRLAAWDPFDKSMRHFKFLFFHQIRSKDSEFFSNYAKIGLTSLGNPVTLIAPSGDKVNIDHFFSIEEYTFLNANLSFDKIRYAVEIGAGFGRTAQALIKLVHSIEKYTIIDIQEVLSLSRGYLERVLSTEEFKKLNFVNALSLPEKHCDYSADLVINIDSFQEMPQETIRYYLEHIVKNSQYLYSKNAVGKYRPESVGLYGIDEKQLLDVFSLGLSTEVIDIFNETELKAARQRHISQYRPSQLFDVIAQEPLGMFQYYLNVLYGKQKPDTQQ
jgi:putative sugar O-methyltransferase